MTTPAKSLHAKLKELLEKYERLHHVRVESVQIEWRIVTKTIGGPGERVVKEIKVITIS